MFQGTASNAGKSILATALCRVLRRHGWKVAPFKAQNMSLNSTVDIHGGELGVAQALQARACGLEPDASMNPILLKPMGGVGSQVIVRGRPWGTMPYGEYVKEKRNLWRHITAAYRELAQGRDAMVLEGAGSPAEINLRRHDVVNMRMAAYAQAAVILVADIDLGGAFAALMGTMDLLSRTDRERVSGFLLNKFRGDASLLDSAMARLSRRWRRPFVGVMPLIPLALPQEDSCCLGLRESAPAPGQLDIAVIALPAMGNVADFDPLLAEPGVCCRLVRHVHQFGNPHAVILPGSRQVPAALRHLRTTGLDEALVNYARRGRLTGHGQLIGLCAGLQILGSSVADPHAIEGGGTHAGLGLLALSTELGQEKVLGRRWAVALPPLVPAPVACHGHEIHHGQQSTDLAAIISGDDGCPLGWGDASVWGTWLHGLFDADAFRHRWLGALAEMWGRPPPPVAPYDLEGELNRLADAAEAHWDMDLIFRLLSPHQHE